LPLVYGNSPEYRLKRQLLSSSCFTRDEVLYGYKEDQESEKEQEEPINDNELKKSQSWILTCKKHHCHHNTKEEKC
jgi:hypothetical protein